MKKLEINSNQIITLNDYPVYNNDVLIEYFDKCKRGEDLALVPVVEKDIVKKYFSNSVLNKFEEFEKENISAEYFMLDGSHRTTALTLAGCKITIMIYENDKDIKKAKELIKKGKILENDTLNHNLKENCKILNKHFSEKPYFMTVKQKTDKMIKENILPKSISVLN